MTDSAERIRVEDETVVADNWNVLKNVTFSFRTRAGVWQRHVREVYVKAPGASVLLCHRARRSVLLVRQFRYPVYEEGGPGWLLETCAGLLDGEAPEASMRREIEEETGYRVDHVQHVMDVYTCPGASTEKLHLFLAAYEDHQQVHAGGGLEHEGEDIEVLEFPIEEALAMVADGRIVDAKTVILLQHAALNGVFD